MKTPKIYSYEHIMNVRVVDGDTIEFTIDLGYGISFKDLFRLKGLDVYEMSTKKGREAKLYVKELFEFPDNLVLYTYKVKPYKTKKGKYGRYLFDAYIESCGYLGKLTDILEQEGFKKEKK